MPDTISPEDALTLALTNKRFARHVVKKALTQGDPDLAGARMHPEARRRHNARLIRENKLKASEVQPVSKPGPKPNNGSVNRPSSFKPLWDGDQLRLKLQSYDRTPFIDLLALWMECAPSVQTILAFANKYPDRWTKALVDLGRLGGFAERKEIDVNFAAQVQRMSDSQLMDQIEQQAYRLGIPLPTLLTSLGSHMEGLEPAPSGPSRDAIDVVPAATDPPQIENGG